MQDILEFTSSDFERLLDYPDAKGMLKKIHKEWMALEAFIHP